MMRNNNKEKMAKNIFVSAATQFEEKK